VKPSKISVSLVDYGREHWMLRWIDPGTGKRKTVSSGCKGVRDAHKAAETLEKELNSRIPNGRGSVSLADFMLIYNDDHLESLSENSGKRSMSALNVLKTEMDPETIGDISSTVLSAFVSRLRHAGRSEATIATNLRTIKAALSWAKSAGYLGELPAFPSLRQAKGSRAKGRPLTNLEVFRMVRAVRLDPNLCRLERIQRRHWRRLIIGLWLSGLRLEEALRLSWEPGTFQLETAHAYPQFVITEQKSGKLETVPLTPDFGRWILKTPLEQRHGFVFHVPKVRHVHVRRMDTTSKVLSSIGEISGVVVSDSGKFASAHDLRRSFGLRWASRVMPAELRQLMRHSDISTTMSYYVQVESQAFAEKLWKSDKQATPKAT